MLQLLYLSSVFIKIRFDMYLDSEGAITETDHERVHVYMCVCVCELSIE